MKLFNLALAGLVALVAASPVETTAIAASKYKNDGVHTYAVEDRAVGHPSAKYKNDDKVTYHCDRDVWIIACPATGACANMDYCLVKCIENKRGAECSPKAPEKRDADTEANAEDKKTYECSNDHTGVLVCQYGFCQTDHYCKKGTKCRNKCTCCRSMTVLERGIDDLDNNKISQPKSDVADPASRRSAFPCGSDNLYPYRCFGEWPGEHIDVCNPATNQWQLSASCGAGLCEADKKGVPYCTGPRPPVAASNDVQALTVVESDTLASRADAPCVPGTYTCKANDSTGDAWIVVCGWNGVYQYSSNCGDMKCLSYDTGVAHCWNPGKEWDSDSLSVSRRGVLQGEVTSALGGVCQTGLFACSYDPATNTAWIIVCDANQIWQYLRSCGQNQKCSVVPPGSGNVLCTPLQAIAGHDELDQVPSDLAPSLDCRPGSFTCTWRNDTQTSWVITCDQSGHRWVYSANCGHGMGYDESGSTAHCVPGGLTLGARDELLQVPSELGPALECHPGEFGCTWNNNTMTEWIFVCDQSGHNWQWSADCGKGMKCVQGGGVAHCVAQKALFEAWETVQSLDLMARQDPNACTHPGEVACNDHIVVRCDNGRWTEIQNCGPDVCAIDQDRVPHCIPPIAIAASTMATVVVGAAASAKA